LPGTKQSSSFQFLISTFIPVTGASPESKKNPKRQKRKKGFAQPGNGGKVDIALWRIVL
jgi:hypothetical protein